MVIQVKKTSLFFTSLLAASSCTSILAPQAQERDLHKTFGYVQDRIAHFDKTRREKSKYSWPIREFVSYGLLEDGCPEEYSWISEFRQLLDNPDFEQGEKVLAKFEGVWQGATIKELPRQRENKTGNNRFLLQWLKDNKNYWVDRRTVRKIDKLNSLLDDFESGFYSKTEKELDRTLGKLTDVLPRFKDDPKMLLEKEALWKLMG